ncbi:AMP-binding protein [Pseudoalteromonas luteoviolacea]|uniref:AMP-binding protein n=1 Tax=Pseudoalteromonas luteoviolacea TaxID=43657 RepID=UPI001B39BE37|nr:class I adenylate-forming enzyme family protein [Pseudoalteromonas luteoviolacea]MBQ4839055.1 acyl--CoA ligase [Pseudoalteromonas luteoviolacea]
MNDLSHLKLAKFSFVLDTGEVKTAESFWHDSYLYSKKLGAAINKLGIRATPKAVLFDSDPYTFGYKLFALLARGCEIALPNNQQPSTLEDAVSASDVVCGSAFLGVKETSTWIDGMSEVELGEQQDEVYWPTTGTIVFFTSGSTGKSKQIRKAWQSLQLELDILASTFELSPVREFVSTVPHYHIYGLLFRLLLPMKLGVKIHPTKEYPEHVLPLLKTAEKNQFAMISSPAFLKRLCNDNVLASNAHAFNCIFSSGGELKSEIATKLYSQMQLPIREIYGSTESGGIAHRQQTQVSDSVWTLFEGMSISVNPDSQQLVLSSPYLNFEPLLMGDKVKVCSNGQFKLLGRIDRTVKIEEKRVNLSALERTLEEHAWIQSSKVILLEGKRSTLAAVVVLNIGNATFESKHQLNQILRQHLANKFELICIPKKWRYVEEFPINNQGKTTAAALEKLFE